MRFHPFKCGSKIKRREVEVVVEVVEVKPGGAQEIVINTSSISPDLARNGDRSLVNDTRVGLILPHPATVSVRYAYTMENNS